MLFGEVLRETRKKIGLSLKELSRLSETSASYLSVLENEPTRFPSSDILMRLIYGLRRWDINNKKVFENYEEIQDLVFKSENFKESDIDIDTFQKEFYQYIEKKYLDHDADLDLINKKAFQNKISIKKNKGELHALEYPYFDLEWLFSQNEYELFYGRKYLVRREPKSVVDIDYNALNEEDIKMIRDIIKVYIENKYDKIVNPKAFFEQYSKLNRLKKRNELFDDVSKEAFKQMGKVIEEIED